MDKVASLKQQILSQLDKLTPEQQQQVLDFANGMQTTLPRGTRGEALLERMDSFEFGPGDLDEITRAVEEGCERIDRDEW